MSAHSTSVAIAALIFLTACGTGQPEGGTADHTNTDGSGIGFILDVLDSATPAAPGDTALAPLEISAECPGAGGCPCQENGDCDGAVCIETPEGQRCAHKCVDSCPEGYACLPVDSAGGDTTVICVPKYLRLCDPCNDSGECKPPIGFSEDHGQCADYGPSAGGFCGVVCATSTDCPTGYQCETIQTRELAGKSSTSASLCVRSNTGGVGFGTCECGAAATSLQKQTACVVDSVVNGKKLTCTGMRTCTSSGLSECTANDPQQEVCDGVDNDCDGQTDESSCDDKNDCTVDVCLPATATNGTGSAGTCVHTNQAGSCDADNNMCTESDTCVDGQCQPGPPKNCDDANECTVDACDQDGGCSNKKDDGTPCDGGNKCTVGKGKCAAGSCQAANFKECPNNDPCVVAKCDQNDGDCKYIDKSAGASCDDNDKCTGDDTCQDGACAGLKVNCDDGQSCTTDSCTPNAGCVFNVKAGACDDGNVCTKDDVCEAGKCGGTLVDGSVACDDGNPCTKDVCSTLNGCSHPPQSGPCDDGDPCTSSKGVNCQGDACDACKDGKCAGDMVCKPCAQTGDCADKEDGNPCNGTLVCSGGFCKANPGTVVQCDASGNTACLKNACEQATGKCSGLKPVNEDKGCDDGDACSLNDACKAGKCVGPDKKGCDDANPCTTDVCSPKTGCDHPAADGACDDGDACTEGDACAQGKCVAGKAKGCDDGDVCTDDACDKASGCTHLQNKAACDDNNACTEADVCAAGACAGGKKDCDDKAPCTDDSCDAKSGCVHSNNEAACSDNDKCTNGDKCSTGKCAPGATLDCDDKNGCTADSCAPASGCVHTPQGGGCDDGDSCTSDDACKGGKCVGQGLKSCTDGNDCTDDGCDANGGCVNKANTKACDDGDPCSSDDNCGNGTCHAGKPKICDDSNACTTDACQKGVGCVYTPNTKPCDDGDACTADDTCGGGKCMSGPAKGCEDGNPCTANACDPKVGCTAQPKQGLCDDNDPCTIGDACSQGTCQAGTAKDCAVVADQCNTGVCNGGACAKQPKIGDCDDGNLCTLADKCLNGKCKSSENKDCSALNSVCAVGTCAAGNCAAVAKPGPCDDGNACTTGDTCAGTDCKGLKPVNCADNAACTKDTCNTQTGCQHEAVHSACNDSVPCTTDTCSGSGCKNAPNHSACNDSISCTNDSCVQGVGCKHAANNSACNDNNACTSDKCNAGAGCLHNSYSDGTSCGGTSKCVSGKCKSYSSSCSGRCGQYDKYAPCNCDNLCGQYNDCCSDYKTKCDPCANVVCGKCQTCSNGKCIAAADCTGCGGSSVCVSGNCTYRSSFTVDGCTGSNFVPYCNSGCYSCKPQGGFSATTASSCGGLNCFNRFQSSGQNGMLVMYSKSNQTAYATWQFPSTLKCNWQVDAYIPNGLPGTSNTCTVSKSSYVTNAYYHLKAGGGDLKTKWLNHATNKNGWRTLFTGNLSGATGVTLGNKGSPNGGCNFFLVDAIRMTPK